MKRHSISVAAVVAAAFAGSTALAQGTPSTPPGDAPNTKAAAAAGSAPAARDKVKQEAATAVRSGEVPKGDAQATKKRPQGAASAAAASGESRGDVKAEQKAAAQAGETVRGDAGTSGQNPRGGAVGANQGQDAGAPATREGVKAEAKAAKQSGEVPKGDAGVKSKP